MPLFPASLVPWIALQFCDSEGHPLVGGKLWSLEAGTDTPRPTYTDQNLAVANTNPLILDAAGRPETGAIYVEPGGYKFILKDANDVELFTIDGVEDVGATFAAQFGLVMSAGSRNVTSGYTVLVSDRLVTVDSTGGPDPCIVNLLSAADATQPVTIKNNGIIDMEITPNGSDTIEGAPAAILLPGMTAPGIFTTVTLVSDGVNAWLIQSSHGYGV